MSRQVTRRQTPPRSGRAAPRRRPSRVRARIRAFLGLLFLGAAAYAVFAGPLFQIEHIEVDAPPECRSLVEEGVPIGRNLFLFRTDALRDAVARHPVVESVSVTRVLPDTIAVTARPRVACATVRLTLGDFEVDRHGVIFRAATGESLPRLAGSDGVNAGGGRVDPEGMAAIVPWLDALPRYALPPVAKVDYLGAGKCNLALADGRLVKLGSATDVDLKLAAAEALLAGPAREAEYVDMEVTNAGVIGEKRVAPQVADQSSAPTTGSPDQPAPAGGEGTAALPPSPAASGTPSVS